MIEAGIRERATQWRTRADTMRRDASAITAAAASVKWEGRAGDLWRDKVNGRAVRLRELARQADALADDIDLVAARCASIIDEVIARLPDDIIPPLHGGRP